MTNREGTPWSARTGGFLVAEAVSAIGSMATFVAIWAYAAYEYDASATDVGLFGLAFSLPPVLLGPFTGTVIDRIGARPTLAIAKVIGIVASLALLTAGDFRTLALLSALHGISSAFAHPAIQSLPPRLVADEHLARTNALVSLTDELAIVVGPAVAGIGIAAFGFHGAFVFDAATYALGLIVLPLARLRPVEKTAGDEEHAPRFRDALRGIKVVARSGILRRVVAATAAVNLLYGTALLAEPLYVRDVLEESERVFAALQSAFGVFLVAGGVLAAKLGERLASFGWVALGVGASGLTAIVYLGTPWIAVAFVGVMLWGLATAAISGPGRTVIQRSVSPSFHGRVMATDLMAGNAAQLVGLSASGLLIAAVGVQWAISMLGVGVATVALLLWRADRRDTTTACDLTEGLRPEPLPA